MALQINTNFSKVNAQFQAQKQVRSNKLNQSLERLSTGLKVNRAKDDPAGLTINAKLAEQIGRLDNRTQFENDILNVEDIRSELESLKEQLGQQTFGFQFNSDVLNATIESELEQGRLIFQAEQADFIEAGQGISTAISEEISQINDFTVDKVISALEDSEFVSDDQIGQLQEKRSEIQSEIDEIKQTGADFADSFEKFVQGFSSLIATNNVDDLGSFVRGTVNFVRPENNFSKEITDNFFEGTSQVALANKSTVDDFLNFFNEGFRDSGADKLLDNPDLADEFITAARDIAGLGPSQLGGDAGFFANSQNLLDTDRLDILDRFVNAVNSDKTIISSHLVDDLGFTLTQTIDSVANQAIDTVTELGASRASDAATAAVLDRSRQLASEGVTESRQLSFLEQASGLKDVRNLDEFVAAFDAVKVAAAELEQDDLVDRFLQATSSVASGDLAETDFFVRVAGIATFSPDDLRTQLVGVIAENSPNETGVLVSGVDESLTNLGEVNAQASTSTLDNIIQLDLSVTETERDAITQELVVVDNPLVDGSQGKATQVEFAVTTKFKGTAGSLDVGNIISLVVTAGGSAAKEVSEEVTKETIKKALKAGLKKAAKGFAEGLKDNAIQDLEKPVLFDILAASFTAASKTLELGQALNEKGEITEEDIADIELSEFSYENASQEVKDSVKAVYDFLTEGVSASGNIEVVFTDDEGNEETKSIVSINPFDLVVGSFDKEEGTRTVKFTADLPDSGKGEFSVSLRAVATSTTNKALGGAKSSLEASLEEIAVSFLDGETYRATNEVELTPTSALPVEEDNFNSRQAFIVDTFAGGNSESVIGKIFTDYNTAIQNIQTRIETVRSGADELLNGPVQPIVFTPPDPIAINPELTAQQALLFEQEGIHRIQAFLEQMSSGLDFFQNSMSRGVNFKQAESTIMETDFSQETQRLTRAHILQQTSLNINSSAIRNQNIMSLL